MQQLPHRDPQDRTVDRRQPGQRPALEVRGNQLVDVRGMLGDAVRDGHRVRVQRVDVWFRGRQRTTFVGHRGGRHLARLGLEQQVHGPFAGLAASPLGRSRYSSPRRLVAGPGRMRTDISHSHGRGSCRRAYPPSAGHRC
ncbi:Uncharacterised protein [Mycobacteroides abscessus subsp. massiliense]|nr:Uncharacterised protein [Mycobacteroides abscessus subsp. massiliense]